MSHPALSRIQRLHAAMDAREINTLVACREIASLAKELQETDPDAFSRYEALAAERRAKQYRDYESQPANNAPEVLKPADKAAKSAIKPLRNLYCDAAERRRTSANARRWCIESGVWTIRDLTDTQSRVLVELLRECLKAKRKATYLTHDQLAERAGCSRSSVKTTIRLLVERSLIFVRRERISARKNAPNLYLPCRQIVQALGPYVSTTMSIGGQDTAPLGLRDNKSINPTENPTPPEKAKKRRTVNGKNDSDRKSPPRPSFNAEDREIVIQAIPLLDGKPISPRIADGELHARIDMIRAVLLPEISAAQYGIALRERGTDGAIALLATALKAMTRTTAPIRSPVAYFRGTVSFRRTTFNPAKSLRSTIGTHLECANKQEIAEIFVERVLAWRVDLLH
ncbi:replication protein [Rhodospirillaceae bacterium KN72]|uniref:Replication protein n=1 Tax=Pacificispira spongiicola TaxID=2729598 RepID=A0A7Y0DYF4_9PROT|nr:hypothetical protein [Pacificispira spongiicola]NMM43900.1 replication protein [Pacificispira spongiicola]